MAKLYEYLITASDGAAAADSSGNGWDATVDTGGGAASITSNARGHRLVITGASRSNTAKIQRTLTAGEASALNGKTAFSIIFSTGAVVNPSSGYSQLFRIGTAPTAFLSIYRGSSTEIRLNNTSGTQQGGGAVYPYSAGMAAFVVDTSQPVQSDRFRFYRRVFDGSNSTPTVTQTTPFLENWSLNITDPENTFLTLMNAPTGNNNTSGELEAFVFLDTAISASEVWAIFDNLQTSSDVSPVAAPVPVLSGLAASSVQDSTATVSVTTSMSPGTAYCLVQTGSAETNAATIKASGISLAVTAAGSLTWPLTGLSNSTEYFVSVVHAHANGDSAVATMSFSTLAAHTESTTATVAVPASLTVINLASLPDNYTWEQLPRTPAPGWQFIIDPDNGAISGDGYFSGDTQAEFNAWIIDNYGRMSRIQMDTTGLSGVVRPDAPTFAAVTNAEPGSTHSWTFTVSGIAVGETISIQAVDVGATVSRNGGAPAETISGVELGDEVELSGVASSVFGESRHPGVMMTGGVSATATLTTRAAVVPVIATHVTSQSVTSGTSASFSFVATGAASQQWYERIAGVDTPVAGATGTTLALSNVQMASSGRQFFAVATSSEGGTVRTPGAGFATLTVIASATRVRVPALRDRASGQLRGGENNVPCYVLSDDRSTRIIASTTINLSASGTTDLVSNQLGAIGSWVRVGFPSASGNTAAEVRLQVEA